MQIIGCSADPPKKQQKFCNKQGLKYPMLCDENHEMLKAYGVWEKKKFMGREYMGIFRVTMIIDEKGIVEKVYEKVSVKSHAHEILNDLA
jgi:peroxiredoxin Q/BCP